MLTEFPIPNLVLVAVVLFGLLRYLKYRHRHPPSPLGTKPWEDTVNLEPPPRSPTYVATDFDGCRAILTNGWKSEGYALHQRHNQITDLEARAGPNRRLVDAFGINNLFTSIDTEYRRGFQTQIGHLLATNRNDWRNLAGSAGEYLGSHLQSMGDGNVLIVPLVQSTTFRAVLNKFFANEAVSQDDEAIALVTKTINELWIMSKGQLQSVTEQKALRMRKRSLQNTLKRILPRRKSGRDGSGNPLNIILPAYETMWRVTLDCVVEMLRRSRTDRNLGSIFENSTSEFLNDIDLTARRDGERLPMKHIVNESLRLYPPTKRVYRWKQDQTAEGILSKQCTLIAADIETMQRDIGYWGSDAREWQPSRWTRFKEGPDLHYLPFGSGSMSCPARPTFGPHMIAILASSLYQALHNTYELRTNNHTEQETLEALGGPLESQRDSYQHVFLWKLGVDRRDDV